MSDVYSYLLALWDYWWLLVGGGIFATEQFLEQFFPDTKVRIDKRFRPAQRRRVFNALALVAVFVAAFWTWQDKHEAYQAATEDLRAIRAGSGNSGGGRRMENSAVLAAAFRDSATEYDSLRSVRIEHVNTREAYELAEEFRSLLLNAGWQPVRQLTATAIEPGIHLIFSHAYISLPGGSQGPSAIPKAMRSTNLDFDHRFVTDEEAHDLTYYMTIRIGRDPYGR